MKLSKSDLQTIHYALNKLRADYLCNCIAAGKLDLGLRLAHSVEKLQIRLVKLSQSKREKK